VLWYGVLSRQTCAANVADVRRHDGELHDGLRQQDGQLADIAMTFFVDAVAD
jgi:hypothetical protein